jgi:hypothetical protein
MPRRWVYPDEWYPVLRLVSDDNGEKGTEYTDAELADIRRVQSEFWVWQQEIAKREGLVPDERGNGPLHWDHEIEGKAT